MQMSKHIRLSTEAYDRLDAHKADDETFSDVLLLLAGECSLFELAGILAEEQADALEAAVEERRNRRDKASRINARTTTSNPDS